MLDISILGELQFYKNRIIYDNRRLEMQIKELCDVLEILLKEELVAEIIRQENVFHIRFVNGEERKIQIA